MTDRRIKQQATKHHPSPSHSPLFLVAVLFAIAIVKSRIGRFINRHGTSLMAFLEDHCRVSAGYAVGDQRT
jgi:hypothetical protein